MNYEEFKEKVQNELKGYLGKGYEETHIEVRETVKVNRIVDQVCIANIPGQGNAAPSIPIEKIYENYQKANDFDSVMKDLARAVKEAVKEFKPEYLKDGLNFKDVDKHIFFTLVNTEQNRELLENVPHRDFEDLSIVYRWNVGGDKDGLYTNLINNDFAKQLGKSEPELYEMAMANTKVMFPTTVRNMNEVIADMMFGNGMLDDEMRAEFEATMLDTPPEKTMYVISNEASIYGASALLYEENLFKLSEELGSDLYILPSSVHEAIAISDKFGTPEELAEMVYEINMEQVDLADRLSNQVYHYDKDARTLRLASDTPHKSISDQERGFDDKDRLGPDDEIGKAR